jgi:DNA-binding GntR family transcriptional regulator
LGQGRDITAAARIRDLLRDWIRAEGLRPGDRLPTEAELTARFGVSPRRCALGMNWTT